MVVAGSLVFDVATSLDVTGADEADSEVVTSPLLGVASEVGKSTLGSLVVVAVLEVSTSMLDVVLLVVVGETGGLGGGETGGVTGGGGGGVGSSEVGTSD